MSKVSKIDYIRIPLNFIVLYFRLMATIRSSELKSELQSFLISIAKKVIKHREFKGKFRKDVMQLLIQIRNSGEISSDHNIWEAEMSEEKKLNYEQCAFHMLSFYIASIETIPDTISYCIYELSKSQLLMKRLQKEIDIILHENQYEIPFDRLKEMTFLDNCIKETLRKYPIIPFLNRNCSRDYTIPNTNFKIKKGTLFLIPTLALHHDPKYFKDPEEFIPDRFSANSEYYNKEAYLPYGAGPRKCIAFRLTDMMIKIGIIVMLHKYNFVNKSKLNNLDDINPDGIVYRMKRGIRMVVTKRNFKVE